MLRFTKNLLAQTFKFDCDRFLKFHLLTRHQRDSLRLDDAVYKRPGLQLVTDAGRRWEADKYQDLVDSASPGTIAYCIDAQVDASIGRKPFGKIRDVFNYLRAPTPPIAIIEGEFPVLPDITPGLQEAFELYGLEQVNVRPDILWIRHGPTDSRLIGDPTPRPPFEIHVVDVKMAAEPSLKHFTEVTYYALALAAVLEQEGLADRFGVSAEGYIWPGSHDANAFRKKVRDNAARASLNPLERAMIETLVPVPFEIYHVHVRRFFADRLLRVLGQEPLEVAWHVAPKCQTCEFLRFCRTQAADQDHLCRIPWLNRGQVQVLENFGLKTTRDLAEAIESDAAGWQSATASSHQLRAEGPALLARSRALQTGVTELVAERRTALLPAWADMNIYLTVHFDPGSGITFAMGAKRVYFPRSRAPGAPPRKDEHLFLVDRVDNLNADTERARLIELVQVVTGWLEELVLANSQLGARDRMSAHIYFWDNLELKQLRRMFGRHIEDAEVVELVELLLRMFPPEGVLPDPDLFVSQPGTVVKDVVKSLLGLPLAHDYNLIDVANAFHPVIKVDEQPYQYKILRGFHTDMADQIPFERAYEIWRDQVFLDKHEDLGGRLRPRKYYRDEIIEALRSTISVHLNALEHVVSKFKEHHRGRLVLRKSGFSAAPPTQTRIPERSRRLVAFGRLDAACNEIKNRQNRALPVDEREARFISIRGILQLDQGPSAPLIDVVMRERSEMEGRRLIACKFSENSRDARIAERDFLLALSNEGDDSNLDDHWRGRLGITFEEAVELTSLNKANLPLKRMLRVELVRLNPTEVPPTLVLTPNDEDLFELALSHGVLDLDRPMVLDPLYQDFEGILIGPVLKAVGGQAPPLKRRKK